VSNCKSGTSNNSEQPCSGLICSARLAGPVIVCIYVYVCMCADMYIRIYTHVCMYLYIYAFIHMCMCMYIHICA